MYTHRTRSCAYLQTKYSCGLLEVNNIRHNVHALACTNLSFIILNIIQLFPQFKNQRCQFFSSVTITRMLLTIRNQLATSGDIINTIQYVEYTYIILYMQQSQYPCITNEHSNCSVQVHVQTHTIMPVSTRYHIRH